jgi:phage terminase large subunit GpA-like protein
MKTQVQDYMHVPWHEIGLMCIPIGLMCIDTGAVTYEARFVTKGLVESRLLVAL